MNYDRDWPRAEREFQLALRLSPGYAPAHQWYAFLLVAEGRNEEALRHLERAGELDPLSPIVHTYLGLAYEYRAQATNNANDPLPAIGEYEQAAQLMAAA